MSNFVIIFFIPVTLILANHSVITVSESLAMEWNRRLRGFTMFVFNFGVESLEQSVKLDGLVTLFSLAIPFSKHHFCQTDN